MGEALDGLNVAREQAAGLIDIARPQRLQDQPVILIGPRLPAGAMRGREHQTGIGELQSVEAGEQARHRAGCHQRMMEGAVGGLEILNRLGIVAFD